MQHEPKGDRECPAADLSQSVTDAFTPPLQAPSPRLRTTTAAIARRGRRGKQISANVCPIIVPVG
jgi:hypothetical protein